MAKRAPKLEKAALAGRREFLKHFPGGFRDETYLAWERDYKVRAHEAWDKDKLEELLDNGEYQQFAQDVIRIESRTNLLFSFEKMALRDAVKSPAGAKAFAQGLWAYLYGEGPLRERFDAWVDVVAKLPRKQTRVLTWPVVTVFGMIARPDEHLFVKPMVTQIAAESYGYDFEYRSRPNWETYKSALDFAAKIDRDQRDLKARDMIDLQGFIWVLGSDEY